MENIDETCYVLKINSFSIIGFAGETKIRYTDEISDGKIFFMMLSLSSGVRRHIEPSFMMSMNLFRCYSIRSVPDDVLGVSYCRDSMGWNDTVTESHFLSKKRSIRKLPSNSIFLSFIDIFDVHSSTEHLR